MDQKKYLWRIDEKTFVIVQPLADHEALSAGTERPVNVFMDTSASMYPHYQIEMKMITDAVHVSLFFCCIFYVLLLYLFGFFFNVVIFVL